MKRVFIVVLFMMLFHQWMVSITLADNAEVLPKGVSRVGVLTNFYLPIDQRYNPDGEVEDLAIDYNTNLNSTVFPALSLIETAFGLPPGSGSIGSSVVSFEYDFKILSFDFDYGLSDKVSVGIKIPYILFKNNVDALVDPSAATVGKNSYCYGNTTDPLCALIIAAPFIPTSIGGTPLDTEDVQDLLGNGLDINGVGPIVPGFGFERFETWSGQGIGDIEAGFRYQYLKTKDWRLAFTGGVKFPTGEVDDPDNLVDYGFGNGTHVLHFMFNNDYTGIDRLLINGTVRYALMLPDKETKRVPTDVNLPLTSNKEKVDRDIGDVIELEGGGMYALSKGWGLSLLYNYLVKLKDQVSGSQGFAYQSLEDETDAAHHVYTVGAAYSTFPLYMDKKFPLPLTLSVSYRDRFAGTNNVLKSQYVAFEMKVFF